MSEKRDSTPLYTDPTSPINSREAFLPTQAIVAFLERDGRVLLAKKKAKIGVDQWNGYGGLRDKNDQSLEETLHREVGEETNKSISTQNARLRKIGIVTCHNPITDSTLDDKRKVVEVHFYIVSGWSGRAPKANKEMGKPKWFPINAFPYEEMMDSDNLWLPRALTLPETHIVQGTVFYDKEWKVIPTQTNFAVRAVA